MSKRRIPDHGTASRYAHHGCRCPTCTDANRVAAQRWWERNRPRTRVPAPACVQCGGPLTGQQTKFCGNLCRSRWHGDYQPERPRGFAANPELARVASLKGNGTPEERFWKRVQKTDGCWLWTGTKDQRGYGHLAVHGRMTAAHRYSYELAYGPIPGGLFACHRCDNPACVRPDHLFAGTAGDNARDRNSKGRAAPKAGVLNGRAKLSPEQVADIRQRYSAGGVLQRELAAEYGVTPTQIGTIVRGRQWRGAA